MIELQIENTNFCNAKCIWCPHQDHKRVRQHMGMDLFKKIIDEAETIPLIERIIITGLGEPTLDPGVFDKVSYTRKTMQKRTQIDLYTNGSMLTDESIKKFAKCGLSTLYVSINAANARKRFEIMHLDDYDRIEPILQRAVRNRNGMNVVISAVQEKDLFSGDEVEQYITKWGGTTNDGGHAFLHLEGNWAGWNYLPRTTQTGICCRCTNHIIVLSDGRVALCCQDYDGEVIFGDLNTETIRDVYGKPEYVEYRRGHFEGKRNELKLCKTCTMI